MDKVANVLKRLSVEYKTYSRIKDESFASEVYHVECLDKDRILKFGHSELKYWREIGSIDFLMPNLPMVPSVLSKLDPESGINGALLMDKIPGRPIAVSMLNSSLVEKCATLLAQMHSIPVQGLGYFQKEGFVKVPFANWWDYRKDMILGAWTKTIENKVDADFLKNSKAFLNDCYNGFSGSTDCFVHCDYRPGNILVHENEITGLIDFESARTGDAAYDFIKFHEVIGGDSELWSIFLNSYAKIKSLPDLESSLAYYEFELNYGFLQWATLRSDETLFVERLAIAKSLLERRYSLP